MGNCLDAISYAVGEPGDLPAWEKKQSHKQRRAITSSTGNNQQSSNPNTGGLFNTTNWGEVGGSGCNSGEGGGAVCGGSE